MTKWILKCKNIVDESADVLVCSANVNLNPSGGVGAELLGRHGSKMQRALHAILAGRKRHFAEQGEVSAYSDTDLPYKVVLHAVAVNGFYESSPPVVERIVRTALYLAQDNKARKVVLTALATGYGNLTLSQFADGIRPLLGENFDPVEQVCVCLLEDYRIQQLASALPAAEVVSK